MIIASRFSLAALGLPGTVTMMDFARTPATGRDIIATGEGMLVTFVIEESGRKRVIYKESPLVMPQALHVCHHCMSRCKTTKIDIYQALTQVLELACAAKVQWPISSQSAINAIMN